MPALITADFLTSRVASLAATDPATLASVILSASAAVESYCRRKFLAADYDERYTAAGTGRLFLRRVPVISIATLSLGRAPAETTLDATAYDFDSDTGEVFPIGGGPAWPREWWPAAWPGYGSPDGFGSGGLGNWRGVRAQYRAGYEGTTDDPTAGVPDDVKQAVAETAKAMIMSTSRDPQIQSVSQGGRTIAYATGTAVLQPIEGAAASLLRQWRSYR